jgi:anthranilate synthase/aminodeoxychorismate synthase-like glutamine amidotransferase
MLLVIDNYDSFTYNIVQYLGEMNVAMQIVRNDQITVATGARLKPERLLVSPGPCSPKEAGLSNDILREFGPKIPTLGVCLGHQCIGHTFGANVIVNYRMMHGKTSLIKHNGKDLFAGMPNPFPATRYHSLVIEREFHAGLPGDHRRDRGGRDHGREAQTISHLGRAIPSRRAS